MGNGVEYWYNIHGEPAGIAPGAKQLTPIFALTVHCPPGTRPNGERDHRRAGGRQEDG